MELSSLPTVNAILNATCTVFLISGFYFIRKKNIVLHRLCMSVAFLTSILFLSSYLTYHAFAGSKRFTKVGWIRPAYFSILASHTVLAAVIVPLILVTLFWAWRGQFEKHRRIARWTWPLWMYVSVTGVVIYWMLYR